MLFHEMIKSAVVVLGYILIYIKSSNNVSILVLSMTKQDKSFEMSICTSFQLEKNQNGGGIVL